MNELQKMETSHCEIMHLTLDCTNKNLVRRGLGVTTRGRDVRGFSPCTVDFIDMADCMEAITVFRLRFRATPGQSHPLMSAAPEMICVFTAWSYRDLGRSDNASSMLMSESPTNRECSRHVSRDGFVKLNPLGGYKCGEREFYLLVLHSVTCVW
jgi:hypothetical protein